MFEIVLIIHVLSVVFWAGGGAYVSLILLPSLNKLTNPLDKLSSFRDIEKGFTPYAKVYSIIVGLSGLYLMHLAYKTSFSALFEGRGIYVLLMFLIWLLWILVIFVVRPIIKRDIDKLEKSEGSALIDAAFKRIRILHYVMFALSIAAICFGVLA